MMACFETSMLSLISIILILKITKHILIIGKVKQERKDLKARNRDLK